MSPDRDEDGGQRARNKAANRAAILAAGIEVFGTIGYDAAVIRDIVRRSGLSPGTFYNYFPDKDAVFSALVAELLGEMRPALHEARVRATSVEAFVRDAFSVCLRVLAKDEARLAMLTRSTAAFRAHVFGEAQLEGVFADLEQDMRSAMKAGLLPAFNPEHMTAAMVGAAIEVCIRFARPGADLDELARFLATIFIGGIDRIGKP